MIDEHELWACANMLLQRHGAEAPVFVAERIGVLAMAGDREGLGIWKGIAARMDRLMYERGPSQ